MPFNRESLKKAIESVTTALGNKTVYMVQSIAPKPTLKHTYSYVFDEVGDPLLRNESTTEEVNGVLKSVPTRVTKATPLFVDIDGVETEVCKGFQWTAGLYENKVLVGTKKVLFWEIPTEAANFLVENAEALNLRCGIDHLHPMSPKANSVGLSLIAFGDRCDQLTGIGVAKAVRKTEAVNNAMSNVAKAVADRRNAKSEAELENQNIG